MQSTCWLVCEVMYFATHIAIPFHLYINPTPFIPSFRIVSHSKHPTTIAIGSKIQRNQKKQQQQQIVIFLDIILYYYTCIPKCQSLLTYALAVSVVRQPNTHTSCISLIKMYFNQNAFYLHVYKFKFVSVSVSASPYLFLCYRTPSSIFVNHTKCSCGACGWCCCWFNGFASVCVTLFIN